ncbi:PREDICTED: mitogen-activated protein kinase kinase kinase 15-like, partial [Rhinopithecus bieti]|uniref:mitogen-activated protein kinase kinase kinase 15-like n=1 Tax=Rhinopithecus bieti TaxID=61621 RepID=UPI00083C6D9E
LQAHFEPTCETEGVDKDMDEVEEGYPPAARPGQEAQPHQQHLSLQLGELRQETNRLIDNKFLIVTGITENPAGPYGQRTDKELIDWLRLQGADAKTIEKIVEEGYTLSDILNEITKEDLRYLRLRGGLLCRLWSAVSQYRRAQETSETKDEA